MRDLLALLTRPEGRIGRARFWLGMALVFVLALIVSLALFALGFGKSTVVSGTVQVDGGVASAFKNVRTSLDVWPAFIVSLLAAYPATMLGIKRRHDRNFSGWDMVAFTALSILNQLLGIFGIGGFLGSALGLVLLVWGFCLFILLGFLKGTTGPNRYGADPLTPPPVA